uniref:Saposin B-type domain-containing protein n=1 Tax=Caenorhabditis tropicalis TaxID=1561998 RepID=A0A1I7TJC4_9PELO
MGDEEQPIDFQEGGLLVTIVSNVMSPASVSCCSGAATTTTTTTTTVATTTTTVTEAPFPCNVCQKVYDTTCQGFGIPNLLQWCPTAAEAAVEYTLGLITSIIPFIPAGSCATIITCPLTTSLRIKLFNTDIPAPVFYAWCEESGANAGTWYTGVSWLLRFELVSLACRPVISGK